MSWPKEMEEFLAEEEAVITPFLNFKPPVKGKYLVYKIKILGELEEVETQFGVKSRIDVELIKTNDPDYKPGRYRISTSVVALVDFLKKVKAGQTWLIANMGRPKGKRYYTFKTKLV